MCRSNNGRPLSHDGIKPESHVDLPMQTEHHCSLSTRSDDRRIMKGDALRQNRRCSDKKRRKQQTDKQEQQLISCPPRAIRQTRNRLMTVVVAMLSNDRLDSGRQIHISTAGILGPTASSERYSRLCTRPRRPSTGTCLHSMHAIMPLKDAEGKTQHMTHCAPLSHSQE